MNAVEFIAANGAEQLGLAVLHDLAFFGGLMAAASAVFVAFAIIYSVQADKAAGRGRWVRYVSEGGKVMTVDERDEYVNKTFADLCAPCHGEVWLGDPGSSWCICQAPCGSERCERKAEARALFHRHRHRARPVPGRP